MINKLKHITIIIVLILCISFNSCNKEQKDETIEPINKEKLISVLVDIHLLDGIFSFSKIRNTYDNRDTYRDIIFKKHNITSKQFNTTILYYTKHTKEFGKIYSTVERRLMELETEVQSKRERK